MRRTLSVIAILSLTGFAVYVSLRRPHNAAPVASHTTKMPSAEIEALRPKVAAFCGNCHANPPPESFPKDAWFAEVEQGYRFYVDSKRNDLHPPPMNEVVAYFRTLAPKEFPKTTALPTISHSIHFTRSQVPLPPKSRHAAVSHIQSGIDLASFVSCDMVSGEVTATSLIGTTTEQTHLASLNNPAHAVWCDLNRDGHNDLVIADLGSAAPGDHTSGRVVWLKGTGATPPYEPHVLLDGVGRVADVQLADFNGDGHLDLLVAEFGWRKSGRILLLSQRPDGNAVPAFDQQILDERHGAIHVPVADFNGDGRPDFVALISQEFESVELFLNQADGQFQRHVLFAAGDPSFGSSGIELVDLDHDSDIDVLYTNGDTLDSFYLKPTHGVHWFENEGTQPFTPHRLASLPGATRATAVDLDDDGDLDVVATAYLPSVIRQQSIPQSTETLIWIEQLPHKSFARHTLEIGSQGHMTLHVQDCDSDGKPDLIVGNYSDQAAPVMSSATVWMNRGVSGIPEKK